MGKILAVVKMYKEYFCFSKSPYVHQKNTTCCGSMHMAYKITRQVKTLDILLSCLRRCRTLAFKALGTDVSRL